MSGRNQSWRSGRKGNHVRFPGITEDARTLGVNRATLYRVLTGEFHQLKTLRRRYEALKRTQAAHNTKS